LGYWHPDPRNSIHYAAARRGEEKWSIMDLLDQAREFLKAHEYSVEDKDRDLLVAEHAGLGRGKERICVWVSTRENRADRQQLALQTEYLKRFQGLASKYHGARLYFLVDTMEGFLAEFRSESYRDFGVTIQVPAWFFDLPFRHEDARSAATAIRELLTTAKEVDKRRVPQNYEGPDARIEGVDLVQDLARVIASETTKQNPKVWVIAAPAGQGKTVVFNSLFMHLQERFAEQKKKQLVCPRPLPMLPQHLQGAAGRNIRGLIDAFLQTDIAMPTPRRLFDWMIDNRYGLLMLDGLDELIAGDPDFIPYLEDRITAPQSAPLFVLCVRDSLLHSCEALADFLDYYNSAVELWRLKPWSESAQRTFAWFKLEGRAAKPGEHDSARIAQFLQQKKVSPVLNRLASLPFFLEQMLDVFKGDPNLAGLHDELGLLDVAVRQMCMREYGKGVLREDLLPLAGFTDWLEDLAVLRYELGGVPTSELRVLAELLPALATRELSEDETLSMTTQITMAPFLRGGAISGQVEFAHEILADYLAARRFAQEFNRASP